MRVDAKLALAAVAAVVIGGIAWRVWRESSRPLSPREQILAIERALGSGRHREAHAAAEELCARRDQLDPQLALEAELLRIRAEIHVGDAGNALRHYLALRRGGKVPVPRETDQLMLTSLVQSGARDHLPTLLALIADPVRTDADTALRAVEEAMRRAGIDMEMRAVPTWNWASPPEVDRGALIDYRDGR